MVGDQQQAPDVLVFDMDGVLVEVTQSYREAIRETVRHFTGGTVSHDLIQDFKDAGGWNNDWLLSHRLIKDLGQDVAYGDVVDYFNSIFLGTNGDGMIRHEKWMPSPGFFDRLREYASLAIFTGRAKYEADVTLVRHANAVRFDPIVTDESVARPKPAPDGLELIRQHYPDKTIWYLGDTVDDARSAAAAEVPFIGVAMPQSPRHKQNAELLLQLGAFTVLQDVNELEELVSAAHSRVK
ncbi:MAG: HAD hydrolase-like protein [Acidobacteriaceae bacterium]|nr:HAD hydrolase-like protein [Acidobacteriaceae bacterium]